MERIRKLHFHLRTILPLVYEDSITYEELLYKCMSKINEITEVVNDFTSKDLETYVDEWLNDYISSGGIDEVVRKEVAIEVDKSVEKIEGEIKILNNNITEVDNSVRFFNLKGGEIIFMGDSWVSDATTYPNQIANTLQMTSTNVGVSGARYYTSDSTSRLKLLRQQETIMAYPSDRREEVKLIVVICGLNDLRHSSGTSNFQSAVNEFWSTAFFNAFPNARFIAILDHWYGYKDYNYISYQAILSDRLRQLGGRVCVAGDFFDNMCTIQSRFKADYIHPASTGEGNIAKYIVSLILGGNSVNSIERLNNFVTFASNSKVSPASTLYMMQSGDNLTFMPWSGTHTIDKTLSTYTGGLFLTSDNARTASFSPHVNDRLMGAVTTDNNNYLLGYWWITQNFTGRVHIFDPAHLTNKIMFGSISYPVAGVNLITIDTAG